MSYDFPASPTVGQTFNPTGGPHYIWDGTAWSAYGGGTPPGQIGWFATQVAPAGWLKANGALVSRVTYADLFAAMGTTFGVGDGSTTFGLPDLRGEFLRAWADDRAVDTGRVFGSAQVGGVETHVHTYSSTSGGHSADHTHAISGTTSNVSASHTHTFADSSSSTGNASANHDHTNTRYTSLIATEGGVGASSMWQGATSVNSGADGAAHTHTVAVSGTTGGQSANHTHTFADTSGGASVTHTHAVSGTTAANTGFAVETRPRNIALLVCVKH